MYYIRRVSNKNCTSVVYCVHIDMFEGVLFFPAFRKNPARIPQEKPQAKPLPMHVVPLRMCSIA